MTYYCCNPKRIIISFKNGRDFQKGGGTRSGGCHGEGKEELQAWEVAHAKTLTPQRVLLSGKVGGGQAEVPVEPPPAVGLPSHIFRVCLVGTQSVESH